jgi:hypothetical protein
VRANAAEVIEPLRASARAGAEEALGLLDACEQVRSDTWLLLAVRLGKVYRQLGLAIYCLHEWAEPDDACADIDDYRAPGDKQLDPTRAPGCGHCDAIGATRATYSSTWRSASRSSSCRGSVAAPIPPRAIPLSLPGLDPLFPQTARFSAYSVANGKPAPNKCHRVIESLARRPRHPLRQILAVDLDECIQFPRVGLLEQAQP